MKSYKQIITGTLIFLFGISSLELAHAESTAADSDGVYWVKYTNSEKTACSIFHGNNEGVSTKGVRRDHLDLLRASPGEAGELADIFITKYFGDDLESNEGSSTSESELISYHKPITRRCSTLNILKDALNQKIKQTKNKIPQKPADLVCYSPSKKMKHVFRINSEGEIDWSLFSNVKGTFKSWGKSSVIIEPSNESDDEDCQLVIRNLSTNLKICLPSKPSAAGEKFERKLVSFEVDGFKIPKSQTMRCKASPKFYKSVAFTRAQKVIQLTQSEEDQDFDLVPQDELKTPIQNLEEQEEQEEPNEKVPINSGTT